MPSSIGSRTPTARVVVAGQQAGLLGGPAYSVHKAADAVLLARQLSTEARPVLPVFWIASQDHDAGEVASTSLLDFSEREFRPRLELPQGVPVGRIGWRAEWTAQLLAMLGEFDAPRGAQGGGAAPSSTLPSRDRPTPTCSPG